MLLFWLSARTPGEAEEGARGGDGVTGKGHHHCTGRVRPSSQLLESDASFNYHLTGLLRDSLKHFSLPGT